MTYTRAGKEAVPQARMERHAQHLYQEASQMALQTRQHGLAATRQYVHAGQHAHHHQQQKKRKKKKRVMVHWQQ